jgi:hypothetical protein
MACKDKSKEEKEEARKACVSNKAKRWDPDACSCKNKLIPDAEFKKDSTKFAAGKYDYGKYPININLPKKYQPHQTQEFLDRYTGKK